MLDTERNLPQGLLDPHFEQRCPSFNLPTRMQGVYPYLDWCHHGPRPGALLVGRAVSRTQSPSLTEPPVVVGVGEHAP